jgi:hypothetical protein
MRKGGQKMRGTKTIQSKEAERYMVIIDRTGKTQIYARHIQAMVEYGLWQICCKWYIQISVNGETKRKQVPANIKARFEDAINEIFMNDNTSNKEIYRTLQQIWLNS